MPSFYKGLANRVTSLPTATITGATNTTPITVTTSVAHMFSDGDKAIVYGVRGNTAANNPMTPFTPWTITFISATQFSLNGSVGNGAYVDGGQAFDASLDVATSLPSTGDPPTVASVNVAFEDALDRTQALQDRLYRSELYTQPLQYINWHPSRWLAADPGTSVTAVVDIKTTNVRADGSAECFYSQTFHSWIALGVNTNDIFLIGDEGLLTKKSTGIANKYVHGCESASKLLFFSIDDFTTNTITYDRCAANDATSWSTVNIDAGPYNHAKVIDNVVLPNGHLMLVGGTGNTNRFRSWTSTDHGDTWTTNEVAVPFSGTQYLSGISVGKNSRVFTWAYLTAGANLGDRLWYSDDEGTTWTQTSAIAHGLIRDVIYVSAFDRYLVLTDFGYALTTDPTDPTLYDWNTSVVIHAAVTDGGNIAYSDVSNVSINDMKLSIDMMTSSAFMHRSPNVVYCVAFGGVTGQERQFATLSTYDFRGSFKILG
jgi:hypothetical protein